MRWLQIARKDFDDARRERQLYYLLGLFGLIGVGVGYVIGQNAEFVSRGTTALALLNLFGFLAPIAALMIAQSDIVAKRESGELSALLSLPFSRHGIVVGSYAGRTAVMTAVLIPAFVLAPLVTILRGAPIDIGTLVGAFAVVWILSLIFAAVGLGISAFTRSTSLSAGVSFGVFLLFVLQVWALIPTGVRYLLGGLTWPSGPQPTWAKVFVQLSPFAALRNVAVAFFEMIRNSFPLAIGTVSSGPPWFQAPIFAALVVLAWVILPLAIGYWRFQTTDL